MFRVELYRHLKNNVHSPTKTRYAEEKPLMEVQKCHKCKIYLFVIDLVSPHSDFLDRLVENAGFGLVDWIHGLVGKQVDKGWIAGQVDTRGFLFLYLHIIGHDWG